MQTADMAACMSSDKRYLPREQNTGAAELLPIPLGDRALRWDTALKSTCAPTRGPRRPVRKPPFSALTMSLSPPQPNPSPPEASRSLASGGLLKDLSDLASDLWKELVSHPDLLQIDLIVGMNSTSRIPAMARQGISACAIRISLLNRLVASPSTSRQ